MKKRVVITGMGVVSPIGNSISDFWSNIQAGTCGIDLITAFDTTDFSVKLAAEVKDFNPVDYMDKKEAKRTDRFCQFAIAAAQQAMDDAQIDMQTVNCHRVGVIIGSGVGGINTIETELDKLSKRGPSKVSPFFIPMIISNMASGLVSIRFGAKGVNMSVVTACASGANAIGESFRKIQHGVSDIMIAGGSEASITPATIAGFSSMTALCTSTNKNRASIPFDQERGGFVMGEGAGILVLEEYEHAKARSANIYGEVVGYGATCDAYHMTTPEPNGNGASSAIQGAIKDAGISPQHIGYINAHGTSTPYNDKFETLAIKKVFGNDAYSIPVSSTKSMTGHLIGGAGAIEGIVSILSVRDGYLPPTINYQVPDPDCDLDIIPNQGRTQPLEYALSNSLGFGGHNTSLIFKRYGD